MSSLERAWVPVVTAVAEREGVDPLDLEVPLHDAIDPEVLRTWVQRAGNAAAPTGCRLVFPYYGYTVTLDESGDVSVSDGGDDPTTAVADHAERGGKPGRPEDR